MWIDVSNLDWWKGIDMERLQRKKCGYLANHVCPLKPSKATIGESCDGCALFEKVLAFKELSQRIEAEQKLAEMKGVQG